MEHNASAAFRFHAADLGATQITAVSTMPRIITTLPYAITTPGAYTISSSLTFASSSAAYAITANNITGLIIDFSGWRLSAGTGDTNGGGLCLTGCNDVQLSNIVVSGFAGGLSLSLPGCSRVNVRSCTFISGGNTAVSFSACTSVDVSGCKFLGASQYHTDLSAVSFGLYTTACSGLWLKSCTFSGCAIGFLPTGLCYDIDVRQCVFQDCIVSSVMLEQVIGMIFQDNICKYANQQGTGSSFYLGSRRPGASSSCSNIQIQGNMFSVVAAAAGFDGVYLLGPATNVKFQANTVYMSNGSTAGYLNASLHVGDGTHSVTGLSIKGNQFGGPSPCAIVIDTSSPGTLIQGNFISNTSANGIILSACTGVNARGNFVTNNLGNGISLLASTACILRDNTTSSNGGTGVSVSYDSRNCLVEGNVSNNNSGNGFSVDSITCNQLQNRSMFNVGSAYGGNGAPSNVTTAASDTASNVY